MNHWIHQLYLSKHKSTLACLLSCSFKSTSTFIFAITSTSVLTTQQLKYGHAMSFYLTLKLK